MALSGARTDPGTQSWPDGLAGGIPRPRLHAPHCWGCHSTRLTAWALPHRVSYTGGLMAGAHPLLSTARLVQWGRP